MNSQGEIQEIRKIQMHMNKGRPGKYTITIRYAVEKLSGTL
jgi:hypothetical protein